MPPRRATSLIVLAMLPAAAPAQTAPAAKPDTRETPARQDGKVATVEVKGDASTYDPRRDDTASKTVINADEIRKYGDDNVYDVLKRAPGVTVVGKSLRMRGLGEGYTQILVNGDRPPPGFSLENLAPDQIERIEIVRAASAEFSMQAIAGTINIVLKKVTAKAQRDLRLSYSRSPTGDSRNMNGTLADKVGGLSWFLNGFLYLGRNDSASRGSASLTLPSGQVTQLRNARSDNAGTYRGASLIPRLSWKRENGDELNLSVAMQANRSDFEGRNLYDNLVGSFGNPDYVDTAFRSQWRSNSGQVELGWIAKIAGGKLDLKASTDRSRSRSGNVNASATADRGRQLLRDTDSDTRGRRTSLRGKYTRTLFEGHALSAGLEGSVQESDLVSDRIDRLDRDAPVLRHETFAPKVARLAGYAQDEWSINKQFSVYLGARWEGIRTDSEADSSQAGRFSTSSRNHVLSPVVQTLYKFPDGSGRQLRMALTRTFKAPGVEQLSARRWDAPLNTRFSPDFGGNPDLRPELANGIDLTYEHFLKDGATFSASVSRRAISDVIRTLVAVDGSGRWVIRPVNDGSARVDSLQLEAKAPGKLLWKALEGVDLRASFSRNWSTFAPEPGFGGRPEGQSPMSATTGFDYRKGAVTAGASLSWQKGGLVRVSDAQSYYLMNRRDFDAYFLYKFSPRYQLRLSANNLFGQDAVSDSFYRDAQGVSRDTSFSPGYVRVSASLEMKF